MEYTFKGYKETPNEKHMGIAVVNLGGIIDLRYKILEGKDGKGYFPVVASYKTSENGMDVYQPAFMIDSRALHEDILQAVRQGVSQALTPRQYKQSASAIEPVAENDFEDLPF